jgi:hypothetical protein
MANGVLHTAASLGAFVAIDPTPGGRCGSTTPKRGRWAGLRISDTPTAALRTAKFELPVGTCGGTDDVFLRRKTIRRHGEFRSRDAAQKPMRRMTARGSRRMTSITAHQMRGV